MSLTSTLFGKTGLEGWRAFDGLAPPQVYSAGTELFHQGSRIEDLYWIDRGIIKLTRVHEDGREMIMGLYRPGWVLGATAALLQLLAPATAVTITRCHVRRIRAEEFLRRVELTDHFLQSLIQMVSREAYEQAVHHAAVGLLSGRERLEQFLWEWISSMEGVKQQKPIRLHLPLKQWELAEVIAVTPQYLIKLLRQLEQRNYATVRGAFGATYRLDLLGLLQCEKSPGLSHTHLDFKQNPGGSLTLRSVPITIPLAAIFEA